MGSRNEYGDGPHFEPLGGNALEDHPVRSNRNSPLRQGLSVPSSNPADGILRITQSLSRCSSVASTPQADLGDIAYMTGSDLLDRDVASYLPALRRGSLTTSWWATSTLSP